MPGYCQKDNTKDSVISQEKKNYLNDTYFSSADTQENVRPDCFICYI